MYRTRIRLAGAFAMLVALQGAAVAHSALLGSNPPANAVLTQPPSELRLSFNERVEPRFSGIAVTGSDGRKVTLGRPAADPAKPGDLVVALPSLPAGKYTVRWNATSADSHQIQGSFAFQIKP